MRNFKSVRFAWSKEIFQGVVLCKATKSAVPPRADILSVRNNVCLVPQADGASVRSG